MHPLSEYDLVIFDCDGVILDANQIKINAMKEAIRKNGFDAADAERCGEFFANNFGKSRFYHVKHFVEHMLVVKADQKQNTYDALLADFAEILSVQYASAPVTQGFQAMLAGYDGACAVASGSEQAELRRVFECRGLSKRFTMIMGSPTAKADNVSTILDVISHSSAVMVGDALADLEAADANNIDFIAYMPYSNVPEQLREACATRGLKLIEQW